jgi:Fur family zinc uptake transcriptional regulator
MPPADATHIDIFPKTAHDHARCSKAALERARRLFDVKGLKLTPLRESVLEVVASSHEAVGAYDVLARLSKAGRKLAPISVYRAIEALLDAGVVHRLESRNAYFACHAQHSGTAEGDTVVLVCEVCGRVAEVDSGAMREAIATASSAARFVPRRTVAEVAGTCRDCLAR